MKGAAPPRDLPSLARTTTEAATRSAISSRSHWAMAAIIVEKSRLAGELVSTASVEGDQVGVVLLEVIGA